MIRRPPRSTRTDTLFPYTTLFRSQVTGQRGTELGGIAIGCGQAVQSVSRWTIARLRQFLTIRDRAEDARFQRDPCNDNQADRAECGNGDDHAATEAHRARRLRPDRQRLRIELPGGRDGWLAHARVPFREGVPPGKTER